MATLAQIRSSILHQVSGFLPNDDTRLRARFIDNLIRTKRSYILGREALSNPLGIRRGWYSVLDCLEVKKGKNICNGIESNKTFWYVDLPGLPGFRWDISFLGTIGGKQFDQKGLTSFHYGDSGLGSVGYVILENKAIFDSCIKEEYLRLIAILGDPSDAGTACASVLANADYPIPEEFVHELELLCIKQIHSGLDTKADMTNDGVDKDVPEKPKTV